MNPVKIKRILDVDLPQYHTEGAAGFDLAAGMEYVIPEQDTVLVRTGLVIECPAYHFLAITPRSSLFKKTGLLLSNSPGVVDPDYRGDTDEIMLSLYNTGADLYVPKGMRLCNGIFIPYARVEFTETHTMGASRGGFGSTG